MIDIAKLIIYEDKDMIVCHKPAGVLSQADRGFSEDMVSALMTYEKRKGVKTPFIAPVNRLDRPVEGLILFAKSSKTAAVLTKQITSGSVDKCYYAVVECDGTDIQNGNTVQPGNSSGEQEAVSVTLVDYLVKDAKSNTSYVAKENAKDAKRAELEYQVLVQGEKRSLLKVRLHTGRHHQIRVQLANAGMPLVGDTKYNPALKDAKGWHNIGLCSYYLEFSHPDSGELIRIITVPKSEAFADFLGYESFKQ